MKPFTHDGWLRAAPAVRTKTDIRLRPAGTARIRTRTPGRAPHSAMTTVDEIPLHADTCGVCHTVLAPGVKCDGMYHRGR